MSADVIEFFWDSVSPYTYLAATQIEDLAGRYGKTVRWRPFLLGKAFEATGNRMPAAVPAKGKYLFKDVQLWARHYGVPMRFPDTFPTASIASLRIGCALPDEDVGRWAQAVMGAYWGDNQDIAQPETLTGIAESLGLNSADLLAKTQDAAVKDKLRANTEEAVARGVFGAPTFFVDDRMFWGNDRLPLLEAYLDGRLT